MRLRVDEDLRVKPRLGVEFVVDEAERVENSTGR